MAASVARCVGLSSVGSHQARRGAHSAGSSAASAGRVPLGRSLPPQSRSTPRWGVTKQRAGVLSLAARTSAPVDWKDQWVRLTEENVKSILPEEAMRMVTAGEAVLIDVRKSEDYEQSHALDSASVPLFKAVNPLKTDLKGMLKFAVYAVNGVGAVEANPAFEDEVAAVAGDKAAIFYCEAGGMLEPTPNFMYGRESRSLKAAYKVLVDGRVSKVFHLSGGIFQWYKDGFELTGEYDTANAGRTPNSAAVGTFEEKKK